MGGVVKKVTDDVLGIDPPKMPKVQAPPPAPNPAENKESAEAIEAAAREERRRARLAGGRASTILNVGGAAGLGSDGSASKTLLGQ